MTRPLVSPDAFAEDSDWVDHFEAVASAAEGEWMG